MVRGGCLLVRMRCKRTKGSQPALSDWFLGRRDRVGWKLVAGGTTSHGTAIVVLLSLLGSLSLPISSVFDVSVGYVCRCLVIVSTAALFFSLSLFCNPQRLVEKISCPPISIHLRHQTIIHPYTLLAHASSTPSLAYPPRKKEKKKQNSLPPQNPKISPKFHPPALETQPQHLYIL
ncbi:hypothetical protein M438DRAFT_183147 [Aureobasidium pullulans EXF-150]|uniref:Uncharacterized protein n=1 Tax=Aureobasidium pullulans EXF-150 TaxID=1043002 RepID=A0A074XUM6_AURPU|nr:uncharacterized protein M438DRAFT_183147 [Aureobasidium pullulans EXF-150]KEQ78336.1 hypothetical protein M438DRAFT_183147 [Aureobasidium pullulans EXF-150]